MPIFLTRSAFIILLLCIACPFFAPAQTIDSILNLSANPGESCAPRLVCGPDDRLHLVWRDNLDGYWEIYYRCVTDGQPGAVRKLSTFTGHADAPALAADPAGRVHVVWANEIAGNYDIYYACLTDSGWSAVLNLSNDPGFSAEPCLAVDARGRLFVAWRNQTANGDDIFFRMYDGAAWSAGENLSRLPDVSAEPAIAADDSGLVGMVWSDDTYGPWRVYGVRRAADRWARRDDVYAEQYDARLPAAAPGPAGRLDVAWQVRFENKTDILCRTWQGRWSALTNLSNAKGQATNVRLLRAPSGDLLAVWQETYLRVFTLKYRVRHKNTWQKAVTFRSRGAECREPGLAMDSRGRLWCAWQEQLDGQWEIFLQRMR